LNTGLEGEDFASNSLIAELTSSTYALDALDLSELQQNLVLDVYMLGLHYIFIFYTVCAGLSLVLTLWVGNTSLKAPKATEDDVRSEAEGDTVSASPEHGEQDVVATSKGEDLEKRSPV
jgi:hypothetical protein